MESAPIQKLTTGLSLIIAPLTYLVGQFLLSQWQALQPDPLWFLSHTFLLVGAGLFISVAVSLASFLSDRSPLLAGLGKSLSVVGALALIGQFSIDLAVGQIATSQPAMAAAFQFIRTAWIMNLVFYILAPICLFMGLLFLMLLLAFARLIPFWVGIVALVGFIGIGLAAAIDSVAVFLVGFTGLALIGPMYLGWRILSNPQSMNNHQPRATVEG